MDYCYKYFMAIFEQFSVLGELYLLRDLLTIWDTGFIICIAHSVWLSLLTEETLKIKEKMPCNNLSHTGYSLDNIIYFQDKFDLRMILLRKA